MISNRVVSLIYQIWGQIEGEGVKCDTTQIKVIYVDTDIFIEQKLKNIFRFSVDEDVFSYRSFDLRRIFSSTTYKLFGKKDIQIK